MTDDELNAYGLGWNAAMACAAATIRSKIIRPDVTRDELADHLDDMALDEVTDVNARSKE